MKKKSDGMSPDMFNDATSSTPIPVFTTNEETKNESQNRLQKKTEDFTGVPNGTPVKFQNETEDFTGVPFGTPVKSQTELIKVNFDIFFYENSQL
jgi:hypothetical protein